MPVRPLGRANQPEKFRRPPCRSFVERPPSLSAHSGLSSGLRQRRICRGFSEVGIGLLGVSFAFGLTVLTMAYSIGHISGCHLNPAVTIGLWAGGRFPTKDILAYPMAQIAGAIIAAVALYVIASGKADYDLAVKGLAANGFGAASPGGYSMASGMAIEIIPTFGFLMIILGSTDTRAPAGLAPSPSAWDRRSST